MTNSLAVEYFRFEEDFMEDNIRCIPMIVRYKLDAIGIKLKLKEWSKFSHEERTFLAEHPVDSKPEADEYRRHLENLILEHTGAKPTSLAAVNPSWANTHELPDELNEKLNALGLNMSLVQWRALTILQRFVLLKLSRPSHENRNFPKAMKEFGLVS